MTKKATATYVPLAGTPPGYRDETDETTTLHLAPTQFDPDAALPAYSDDPNPSPATATTVAANPELSRIPNSVVSSDRITITTLDKGLNGDPTKLHSFILQQNEIPPKPTVRLVGTHHETRRQTTKDGKDERVKITDFDLQLDLSPYIVRSLNLGLGEQDWKFLSVVENGVKAYRGGRMKSVDPAHRDGLTSYAAPHLGDWTKAYCADPHMLKSFTFGKTVSNLDTEKLISLLSTLIRSTNYRGHFDITFTTTHSRIQILSPHWVNRLRIITWVRWLFYLTMLWILTWPMLWFLTRRYEVVTSSWPYALIDEQGTKRYAVASEEDWYRRYAVAIRRSMLMRRQGWVTDEDLRLLETGISSGAAAPISAAETQLLGFASGLVHGVMSAARDLDTIRGWGADS
ncbi:hypothetical protein GP486_008187 [Trichoglossum hirsutum]|uniref:Uncharacterized protein n=1 Tax=Trichoglossum hirsutum TaxID=265104 RepID=A0A9P8L789_9PEZI|nr:hypothetical protein GP486_008187 [Trichoglossum hirsutum]